LTRSRFYGRRIRERLTEVEVDKFLAARRLQHYPGHTSIANTVRYAAISLEPFNDIWQRTRPELKMMRATSRVWRTFSLRFAVNMMAMPSTT
jgi:predicted HTH domain antitoxin